MRGKDKERELCFKDSNCGQPNITKLLCRKSSRGKERTCVGRTDRTCAEGLYLCGKDRTCAGRTGPVQEGQDLCGKDKPWDGSIRHNWKEQEMYGSMDRSFWRARTRRKEGSIIK